MNDRPARTILIAGLALFAMYFGAGNLIFPVMIGVEAGTAQPLVLMGFLLTGVLLPILAMIAVATQRAGESGGIATRIGQRPGLVFTLAIFLSTGMFYAIPRVVTISYEMTVRPFLGDVGALPLAAYAAAFLLIALVLTLNPRRLIDNVGRWLTPALLTLLVILCGAAVLKLTATAGEPASTYAKAPLSEGLLTGYFTMDALASFVFGIVIIQQLQRAGFAGRRRLVPAVGAVGIVTAVGLMTVYVGLAMLGNRVADVAPANGAQALAYAADQLFGPVGLMVFGAIAVLACLTTAVGLLGASGQYFSELLPRFNYRTVVLVHVTVSFALANLGLESILAIVAPINQLIYPVAICIVAVALIEAGINVRRPVALHWTYRLSAWVAAAVALPEALATTSLAIFAPLKELLAQLPGGSTSMAWVIPAVAAGIVGAVIDARRAAENQAVVETKSRGAASTVLNAA